eukprot:scaffold145_cov261-Pinguiococcus_pyrenoidosus.AAC.19
MQRNATQRNATQRNATQFLFAPTFTSSSNLPAGLAEKGVYGRTTGSPSCSPHLRRMQAQVDSPRILSARREVSIRRRDERFGGKAFDWRITWTCSLTFWQSEGEETRVMRDHLSADEGHRRPFLSEEALSRRHGLRRRADMSGTAIPGKARRARWKASLTANTGGCPKEPGRLEAAMLRRKSRGATRLERLATRCIGLASGEVASRPEGNAAEAFTLGTDAQHRAVSKWSDIGSARAELRRVQQKAGSGKVCAR